MEENGFHQLEKEFPLARIRSVFEKWFPPISVTVLASRKELSSKVYGLHFSKNPSPKAGMKDSLKNKFPLGGEKNYGLYQLENLFPLPGMKYSLKNTFPKFVEKRTASSGKKTESGFHFLLKLVPRNFNYDSNSRRKAPKKKAYCFHRQKISFQWLE